MYKEIGLVIAVCAGGSLQAATTTYTFEEENGEYLDSKYGSAEDIRALYVDEIAQNQLAYDFCTRDGFADCESIFQFSSYRVRGYKYSSTEEPISFDEYYQVHFEEAVSDFAIDTWTSQGITVSAKSGGGLFPKYRSALGYVIDGGESDGPAPVSISIPSDERLVSIDLFLNPYSVGIVFLDQFEATRSVPVDFQGTFFFDSAFDNVQTFFLGTGPFDPNSGYDVGTMSYDNLVTVSRLDQPSAVPLPAPIALLGFSLFSLGALRGVTRRRNK